MLKFMQVLLHADCSSGTRAFLWHMMCEPHAPTHHTQRDTPAVDWCNLCLWCILFLVSKANILCEANSFDTIHSNWKLYAYKVENYWNICNIYKTIWTRSKLCYVTIFKDIFKLTTHKTPKHKYSQSIFHTSINPPRGGNCAASSKTIKLKLSLYVFFSRVWIQW